MNAMQTLGMDSAGETGEVIFRAPCSLGSGGGEGEPSIVDVLGRCLRWHQGDAWRYSNPERRAAWRAHQELLVNAIAAATEGNKSHE